MRTSDNINYVAKLNMTVMGRCSVQTCEALERQKQKVSANQSYLVTKMFLNMYILN